MYDEARSVIERAHKGDASTIGRAAQDWGSEKNLLRERLAFLRVTIRQKLLDTAHNPASAAVWGNALQNVLDAEYLILDRHVNPTLCLLKTLQSCDEQLASAYQITPNTMGSLGELLLNERQ
jgi:folylpolyglutamate synthase/dihydropteroate synthase